MKTTGIKKAGLILVMAGVMIWINGISGGEKVWGQDRLESYILNLRIPEPGTGASGTVTYEPDVETWILRNSIADNKVQGYRICVYTDHNEDGNGRNRSYGARSLFYSKLPGIPAEVIYNAPTFKVVGGYCLTLTEATILLGRIRKEVNKNAFMITEEFDVNRALQGFGVFDDTEIELMEGSGGSEGIEQEP